MRVKPFILLVAVAVLPLSLWAGSETSSTTTDQGVSLAKRRAEFNQRLLNFTRGLDTKDFNPFNADKALTYPEADYALPNDEPSLQERIRKIGVAKEETKNMRFGSDGGKCVEIKRELESLQREYKDIFTQDEPVLNISTLALIDTCTKFLDKLDDRIEKLTVAMNSGLQMLAARHGGTLPAEFQTYALTSSQSEDVELSRGGGDSAAGAESQASQTNLAKAGKNSTEASTQTQRKDTRAPTSPSAAGSSETSSGDGESDFGLDTPSVGAATVVAGAGVVAAGSSGTSGSPSSAGATSQTTAGGAAPAVSPSSVGVNSEGGYRDFFSPEKEHFVKQLIILTAGDMPKEMVQAYADHVFGKTPLIGADFRNQNVATLAFTGPNHETRGVRMTRLSGPQSGEQKRLDLPGKLPGRLLFVYPQKDGPESPEGKALVSHDEKVKALFEINLLLAVKGAFECRQGNPLLEIKFVQHHLAGKAKLTDEEKRIKRYADILVQLKEILEYRGGADRLDICDVIAIGPALAVFPNAVIEKTETEIKVETHPIHLKNPKLTLALEQLRRVILYASQVAQPELLRSHPEQLTIKPACVLGPNFDSKTCRYQDPKYSEDLIMVGAQVYAMIIDIQSYLFTLRDPLLPVVRVAKGQANSEPPSP